MTRIDEAEVAAAFIRLAERDDSPPDDRTVELPLDEMQAAAEEFTRKLLIAGREFPAEYEPVLEDVLADVVESGALVLVHAGLGAADCLVGPGEIARFGSWDQAWLDVASMSTEHADRGPAELCARAGFDYERARLLFASALQRPGLTWLEPDGLDEGTRPAWLREASNLAVIGVLFAAQSLAIEPAA